MASVDARYWGDAVQESEEETYEGAPLWVCALVVLLGLLFVLWITYEFIGW
jgi:hypothetical protein